LPSTLFAAASIVAFCAGESLPFFSCCDARAFAFRACGLS